MNTFTNWREKMAARPKITDKTVTDDQALALQEKIRVCNKNARLRIESQKALPEVLDALRDL